MTDNRLTDAERYAVHAAQHWLRCEGGDSSSESGSSPKGDGRWCILTDIFPRGVSGTAARQAIVRAHAKGVLAAYEIAYYGGCVKAVPMEQVAEVERAMAAMTPAQREEAAR